MQPAELGCGFIYAAATSSSFVTSMRSGSVVTPYCFARRSAPAGLFNIDIGERDLHPFLASRSAIASPNPCAAPVTSAVYPSARKNRNRCDPRLNLLTLLLASERQCVVVQMPPCLTSRTRSKLTANARVHFFTTKAQSSQRKETPLPRGVSKGTARKMIADVC